MAENTTQPSAEKNTQRSKVKAYARSIILRALLALFDVVAVNASCIVALYVRFYVGKKFHPLSNEYFEKYFQYFIVLSAVTVLVFALMNLYSGRWKYAGFNDMNRIVIANLILTALHVVGTLVFDLRMPITFYVISAVLLLAVTLISRFSYRIIFSEHAKMTSAGKKNVRAMIIGVGGTGSIVMRQLQKSGEVKPVCALDYTSVGPQSTIDGVPVASGLENFANLAKKYNATLVIIASTAMPAKTREEVKRLAEEAKLELQDYSGYFMAGGNKLTLKTLAEYYTGAVTIVTKGGASKSFDDITDAVQGLAKHNIIENLTTAENGLVVELSDDIPIPNDTHEEWVKTYEQSTGNDITFF